MKTRYEILPRAVRFTASFAAVLCTTAVMTGIAGLAEVEPGQLSQSAPVVIAQTAADTNQIR